MPPVYFDSRARCDTTRELAELAWQAGVAGFHSGFRPPRSYYFVRTMQQDGGFIEKDEYGKKAGKYSGIRLAIQSSHDISNLLNQATRVAKELGCCTTASLVLTVTTKFGRRIS
eukprot:scaffold18984_cov73-Cylindrotheca_fusiformis.AAC.1